MRNFARHHIVPLRLLLPILIITLSFRSTWDDSIKLRHSWTTTEKLSKALASAEIEYRELIGRERLNPDGRLRTEAEFRSVLIVCEQQLSFKYQDVSVQPYIIASNFGNASVATSQISLSSTTMELLSITRLLAEHGLTITSLSLQNISPVEDTFLLEIKIATVLSSQGDVS